MREQTSRRKLSHIRYDGEVSEVSVLVGVLLFVEGWLAVNILYGHYNVCLKPAHNYT